MPRLLCMGMGFSAKAVAKRLQAKGWEISATARTAVGASAIRSMGYDVVDISRPGARLDGVVSEDAHLLVSAPPEPDGDPILGRFKTQLTEIAGHIVWVGYLSTTGVYGDHRGGWVDELTPVNPVSPRAQARVKAEMDWLAWGRNSGVPIHIFRLAGIYGPGRSQIDSLLQGNARRIVKSGQVFSRIHVDDLAAVIEASISRPRDGAIYNVCDDEPAPPQSVVEYAASLLGMEPPPLEDIEHARSSMSPMAQSFYAESKRVSNQLIHEELGVSLRFPTFREGLKAIVDG